LKRARSRLGLLLVLGMLTALLPVGALTPASAAEVVAQDMVGTTSLNLVSYTNPFTGAFASAGDGFQKYQRGVSADIPFSVVDDSLVTFPGDNQGIIDDNNLDEFFGVVDTVNEDNSDPVTADWVFDISGAENLELSIDMGAMGDFEAGSDTYVWTYSIDGGTVETAFSSSVDEAATLDYTLADGAVYTLDDPLAVNGTTLNNVLQTITVPVTGTGSELALTLTSSTDGGSEGYAAQNIVIAGDVSTAADLYISEFHYDNASTDTGEFIEVTGTAGMDLSGWSLVLYNGNGGAMYDTIALSGTIDDENGTMGAVAFDTPGLQNGSPDGIALVDPLGAVVEFLSYEGVFDAVDGPAAGLTSADVGVSEPSNSPIGESLQLLDDTWIGPVAESPGDLNTDTTPPIANVYISEFHYDNDGGDTGEFIEVSGDAGADLTGWEIALYNGNGGTVYDTVVLTGTIDDEDGSEGAVSFDATGLQNGSPDGMALVDPLGQVVEFLSYEGTIDAVGGPATGMTSTDVGVSEPSDSPIGESLQLVDGVWIGPVAESPGLLNTVEVVVTPIYEIQGSGLSSSYDGLTVATEGVVTADHQDGDFNGFFIQDATGDGDVTTSDGIFVFEGGNTVDVNVGDVVQVTGIVDEFNGMTEITSVTSVAVTGTATVTATPISLPWATLDQPEQYEGMYVTIPQQLTISEFFNFDRFGEIVLTVGRQFQPTAIYDPGSPEAAALAEANALGRITLDDNRTSQNPDPAIHPNGEDFTLDNLFRGGDLVANVTGVMNYSFDLYRIQPTQGADYTPANPRPASPDDVGGSLEIASFNVLNYFTTFGSRGADDAEEFARQRAKIIAAIAEINADVVGLMEIENNTDAIADLVTGLNDELGAGTYAYVDTGVIGPDEIKVAFIYKPATVALDGDFAVLDTDTFLDPTSLGEAKNRPALAQTFLELATGESVTVAVNHLKSKGSACADTDPDPETASCNEVRRLAAIELAGWLADPANGFDDRVLIIGDLNSYDKEDPIDELLAAGYTDLVYDYLGEEAYSYLFNGQLGYLDYALANTVLQPRVTGTTVWHINADEADLIDYDMTFKQPAQDAIYAPDQYRASDHDAVIVGLDLVPQDETAPEVTAEFDKIVAGFFTGLFDVDFDCTDDVDPDPTCVGDINGIAVEDGQRVFLIKNPRGNPWHRQVGTVLFIKDADFLLTVTGTDDAGNSATATAEPPFRTFNWHSAM